MILYLTVTRAQFFIGNETPIVARLGHNPQTDKT